MSGRPLVEAEGRADVAARSADNAPAARLAAIIARIRRLRASFYPADWTADPWYMVERELEELHDDLKD